MYAPDLQHYFKPATQVRCNLEGGCGVFYGMDTSRKNPHKDPPEPPDFYMEDGRVVFTAHFLRKRGYCCKSGCRHCPYGFRKPNDPKKP